MKHNAIYNLYTNAKTINETEDGVFEVKDANENEVSIDMSAVNTKATELQAEAEAEKQDAINKKASGKQKLLDLGLTEEEVKALIGA
tara:strand:+ start:528 stop:788 length:261 start_codon:yes stop_codon:yes gene_type:complete